MAVGVLALPAPGLRSALTLVTTLEPGGHLARPYMCMNDYLMLGTNPDFQPLWMMLLSTQCRIADRGQALGAGFSDRQIEHRVSTGKWQRVYQGVYATFSGPLPREARLWAALLLAGEGALLSHETAAEVQELADKPSRTIHITVPLNRNPAQRRQRRGIVFHRSSQSQPEFPGTAKLPRTRIQDTVLDLSATSATFDQAYGWIARAVSRGLVTVSMLRDALDARRRIRWRAWLADSLQESKDGVNSALERRYVRDVERAHGLPAAQRQARREIGGKTHFRDNWYAEYRVAVEIDGPAYHRDEQVQRDKDRDNLNLAVDGAKTLRFGPVGVTERVCLSATLVAATLRNSGWRGNPRPCRRPGCSIGHLDKLRQG
jgi:very-short-patch-repair endonuclease